MLRAYKFRMYPNQEQTVLINKTLGCTRFIYNHFLNQKIEDYNNTKKSKSTYDCCKEIPNLYQEYPFLKEVDSCALRCAVFNLEDAFKRFYNKQNQYPKFKSKYQKNSYRTNNMTSTYKGNQYNSIELDLTNKTIKLPKLKEVTIRGYRNLDKIGDRIINATISKDTTDRYCVSIIVEQEDIKIENLNTSIVGIDLGLKELITTSNGETYSNQKPLIKKEKRLKHIQRELSRKQKGSKNYQKCKKKLATLYRKIRNTRNYYIHQITKKLTKENRVIVTEKLNIKQMVRNSRLSKSIHDASWYELIRQLQYKSKHTNTKFYQVETNYPSSQICHKCGHQNKKVKDLQLREYQCDECNVMLERDINASINILDRGLQFYMQELS